MRPIDADQLKENINRNYIISDTINQVIDNAPAITPESLVRQEQQSGCCKFCNTVYEDWSYGGAHDFCLDGNRLFYFDHTFGWEGIGIKFCPMCGRELDSEE